MRILLILPLTSLIRHFESVVQTLAERGHSVTIATPGHKTDWPLPAALANHLRIAQAVCPEQREDAWKDAASHFRLLVDCGRYLEAPFEDASKLRSRAFQTLAATVSGEKRRHLTATCPSCNHRLIDGDLADLGMTLGSAGAGRLKALAQLVEQSIPSDPGYARFLAEQRPDVVLVSPLVGLGSGQADWVKSARAAGIPVGFPVFSWDNLTTKGLVHVQPDLIFVWNEIQKREAVELHGVDADRVVVTGAPRFDAFMALPAAIDREGFCRARGFDPAQPIVTYLCSSEFVAGREVDFVAQWIREIRRAPALASSNVVVRLHPRSLHHWTDVDVAPWGRVHLSKSRVLNADESLHEALRHSDAVVGLNTSAQIEAGILDKPVFTLLAPGFEAGQEGTLHFGYLLRTQGGFVEVAAGFDEHRSHLVQTVEGRYDTAHIRPFIRDFIRPLGWDAPATPILADAVERLRPAKRPMMPRWLGGGAA